MKKRNEKTKKRLHGKDKKSWDLWTVFEEGFDRGVRGKSLQLIDFWCLFHTERFGVLGWNCGWFLGAKRFH